MEIPSELANLEANGGIYAVWMLLQHLGIDAEIQQLIDVCGYETGFGTSTIGLAVGLKKFGFNIQFSTDEDLNIQPQEQISYRAAEQLNLAITPALSYEQIQNAFEQHKFVIVYYDTLAGVGNHSLVYDINENEICFFDSFDAMSKPVFQQQRALDGICKQSIVVEVNAFS